ncbi:hypothetical protein DPMN_070892 [Dreissena polymorpha]|uniref:Uncharacterized protein n=1 Tax=Dreissena polymorpha TaxID=45954 RepID=A0A9D4BVG2_DREPO|nr:hypothetical protein DPMN_070892 [Dreissena polymorpha]
MWIATTTRYQLTENNNIRKAVDEYNILHLSETTATPTAKPQLTDSNINIHTSVD